MLIVRQTFAPVIIGISAGLVGTLGRQVRSNIPLQVDARDPATLAIVTTVLLSVVRWLRAGHSILRVPTP